MLWEKSSSQLKKVVFISLLADNLKQLLYHLVLQAITWIVSIRNCMCLFS